MSTTNDTKQNNRVIFGAFLIAVGALLVFRNMDFFPYELHRVIFSWPALVFGLGALSYFGKKDKATGVIIMSVAGLFLLPIIFDWNFHWREVFWPVILILLGIVVIRKRNHFGDREEHCHYSRMKMNDPDYIDELNILGGGEKVIRHQNFKGGKVTCVFGGTELDLTNAELAEGQNVIDVLTVFGGCTLVVPSDWDVKVEVTAVLGGVTDKHIPTKSYIVEPKKELIIKGFVMMGGCEIKSYKVK
jgi:predicted membrane protein